MGINYYTKAEIKTLSDALIKSYVGPKFNTLTYVDIEGFVKEFLKLEIVYENIVNDDRLTVGFISDGVIPLKIEEDGNITDKIYGKYTIVIDKSLLNCKNDYLLRFVMAHEAAHYIMDKFSIMPINECFGLTGYCSASEFEEVLINIEKQADKIANSLLMPKTIVENALAKYTSKRKFNYYNNCIFDCKDRILIEKVAVELGVTSKSLRYGLKNLDMLIPCNIDCLIQDKIIGGNNSCDQKSQ